MPLLLTAGGSLPHTRKSSAIPLLLSPALNDNVCKDTVIGQFPMADPFRSILPPRGASKHATVFSEDRILPSEPPSSPKDHIFDLQVSSPSTQYTQNVACENAASEKLVFPRIDDSVGLGEGMAHEDCLRLQDGMALCPNSEMIHFPSSEQLANDSYISSLGVLCSGGTLEHLHPRSDLSTSDILTSNYTLTLLILVSGDNLLLPRALPEFLNLCSPLESQALSDARLDSAADLLPSTTSPLASVGSSDILLSHSENRSTSPLPNVAHGLECGLDSPILTSCLANYPLPGHYATTLSLASSPILPLSR